MHVTRQPANAAVDVGAWPPDEKYPVFPIGSKPKRALLCPEDETSPFLRPGHRYLFKAADGWQQQQIWSEVIAYELARPLGLMVPPAFAAHDSLTGVSGVLVEFFYGYAAATETTRFVHGADFMQDSFANAKKGRPHALRENLIICRALKVPGAIRWWLEALLFDTLIGNTDRHSENWGFLFKWHDQNMSVGMAPLYDNGTSLGYGIAESKLVDGWTDDQVSAFVLRGRHDCGWSKEEDGPSSHIDLTRRFIEANVGLKPEAARLLAFADCVVEDVVEWCVRFDLPVQFSPARAEFIVKQVTARRDLLIKVLAL